MEFFDVDGRKGSITDYGSYVEVAVKDPSGDRAKVAVSNGTLSPDGNEIDTYNEVVGGFLELVANTTIREITHIGVPLGFSGRWELAQTKLHDYGNRFAKWGERPTE